MGHFSRSSSLNTAALNSPCQCLQAKQGWENTMLYFENYLRSLINHFLSSPPEYFHTQIPFLTNT